MANDLPVGSADPGSTWQRWCDIPRFVGERRNLVRSGVTAATVGIVLFLINHLGPVLAGDTGATVWMATGLSFLVPFGVANVGLLVASHRSPAGSSTPTWRRLTEALRCVVHRRHLRRTLATALVVGTAYFVINHAHALAGGPVPARVWIAGGLTYLVPFCVSNIGVLLATRRTGSTQAA